MAKHKVLSTKKLEPSLVEEAKKNGIEIIEQEFISVKPVWNKETLERIIGFAKANQLHVALTSANAVDVLNSYMVADDSYYIVDWKIFCLSGKTKKAVESSRFLEENIIGEAENAAALAKEIIRQSVKEIVFFCGNKRRDELPNILTGAGVTVHEVVVYETIGTPKNIHDDFDAILFFSPSSVQSFFAANKLKEGILCFAIGPTTANSLKTFTSNEIIASIAPDQEMLIEEVIEHFKDNA